MTQDSSPSLDRLPHELLLHVLEHVAATQPASHSHNYVRALPADDSSTNTSATASRTSVPALGLASSIVRAMLAQHIADSRLVQKGAAGLAELDGYVDARDLRSLAATCTRLRTAVAAILGHNVAVGDASAAQNNRSPLIRSRQEPGAWRYTYGARVPTSILQHTRHLQLCLAAPFTLYGDDPGASPDSKPWVRILDPAITPRLETVCVVATGPAPLPRLEIETRATASTLQADRPQQRTQEPPRVHLVLDADLYPLSSFCARFLALVTELEYTGDAHPDAPLDLAALTRISALTVAAPPPSGLLPELTLCSALRLPPAVTHLDISAAALGHGLRDVPASVTSLICTWHDIFAASTSTTLPLVLSSITDLCLFCAPECILMHCGAAEDVHFPLLPNLHTLAVHVDDTGRHGHDGSHVPGAGQLLEQGEDAAACAALIRFVARSSSRVRRVYAAGLPRRALVGCGDTAPQAPPLPLLQCLPELEECHIAGELVGACASPVATACSCGAMRGEEGKAAGDAPHAQRSTPPQQDLKPSTQEDAREEPLTFADVVLAALARARCHGTLRALTVRVPLVHTAQQQQDTAAHAPSCAQHGPCAHARLFTLTALRSSLHMLPRLARVRLVDDVCAATVIPGAPTAKHTFGEGTTGASWLYTAACRVSEWAGAGVLADNPLRALLGNKLSRAARHAAAAEKRATGSLFETQRSLRDVFLRPYWGAQAAAWDVDVAQLRAESEM